MENCFDNIMLKGALLYVQDKKRLVCTAVAMRMGWLYSPPIHSFCYGSLVSYYREHEKKPLPRH